MSNPLGRSRVIRVAVTLVAAAATALALVVTAPAASAAAIKPAPQSYLSAGQDHVLVLGSDGRAYAWGRNLSGQLGNGKGGSDLANSAKPVKVKPGDAARVRLTAVSAGNSYSLALGANGKIYSWGDNSFGQLGTGAAGNRYAPTAVAAGEAVGVKFTAIAAGDSHAIALGDDGHVYAWGNNRSGQLGNGKGGSYAQENAPVRVSDGAAKNVRFVAIAAGPSRSFAIGANGRVYAWGSNRDGLLGDGTTADRMQPVAVATGAAKKVKIVAVSAGLTANLALGANGRVYAWGLGDSGQLGNGKQSNSKKPVLVKEGAAKRVKLVAVSAGNSSSFALGSDGHIYAWGRNGVAALGIGQSGDEYVPQRVHAGAAGKARLAALSAGVGFTVVLGANNRLFSWGEGPYGQLGTGKAATKDAPVAVKDTKIPLKGAAKAARKAAR